VKKQYHREKHMASIPWHDVREEWILSRMDGSKGVIAKALADRYKCRPESILNKSSQEKWRDQLKYRIEQRDGDVQRKLKESHEKAVEALQTEFIGNEMDIRRRHAGVARAISIKAVKRLISAPIDSISVRDAVAMLKLGIEEERHAVGIPEVFVPDRGVAQANTEYRSLIAQSNEHGKIQNIALELLRTLKNKASTIMAEDARTTEMMNLAGDAELEEVPHAGDDNENGED